MKNKINKVNKKKGKTKLWAFCLILLCTLLTSLGQLFLKIGSKTASFDLSLITNYALIFGLSLYAVGAILLIIALKGGELSVLYPLIATSFIWVNLLASRFLNDPLNNLKWFGILIIIIGISFMGWGAKK